MKFISVIPARSGSKGIKNKNTYKINKKPLIQYTFEAASKSKIKDCYVLTDSKKIKKIAKKFSIITNYVRPKKISTSKTSLIETLNHFYTWTKKRNIYFDYMVVLQPTSPLRSFKNINDAVRIVKKQKFKSLFSISDSIEHPYETIKIKKNSWSYILKKSKNFYRRQDFDIDSFFINGAIYIMHIDLIKKNKVLDIKNHGFLKMSKSRSLEINDLEEVKIVKSVLKNL